MNPIDGTATLSPVPKAVLDTLTGTTRDRIGTRATDRLASAHDASHYLLTPQAVLTPASASEVAAVLKAVRHAGATITFRSGGTSLSGQASSDGILVDGRRHFRDVEVLDAGARVRTGPGATVRSVNTRLARYGRKLGPDPASEIACTVGGVIANNSSGMVCGTEANTYRTLDSAVLVLADGSIVDTGLPDADAALQRSHPHIHAGLLRLRDRIRGDAEAVQTLRRLFSIKNTMGYGLNSFLDHDDPIRILEHLVVGSEGTLAFVAEATFRTVPALPHAATGLLIFPTLAAATAALPALVEGGFAAIELLDAASLRVAQRDEEAPADLRSLSVRGHAALLVEHQQVSAEALLQRVTEAADVFRDVGVVDATLSTDASRRAQLWHIRKGLYTLVAGARPSGTTALLEDIAVPVDRLLNTCSRLTELFERHGYQDSVIFGHAKDGNVHFMLNERFDQPDLLARYEAFTADLVDLVLGEGGTLKAEHGTGRVMAPYVNRQYGDDLYAVMLEVKALLDSHGILNPGVLLSDTADSHLRGLKTTPTVESEVDRCVECGYCEPVCPSRDLTTTPRERIVLRREMVRAEQAGDTELVSALQAEYDYDAVQTCAVDGMCQTACPVLINTGDLVRRLRAEQNGPIARHGWTAAASGWDAMTRVGGTALTAASVAPAPAVTAITRIARRALGTDTVPEYSSDLPRGGSRRPRITPDGRSDAVYFSSCTTTMFGGAGDEDVRTAFLKLCDRAEIALVTPDGLPSLCCGTPWKSKGLTEGYEAMRTRVVDSLMRATAGGTLPVISDASSCSEGLELLLDATSGSGIRVVDAVAFVDEVVLPRLPQRTKVTSLTLHPTCSSTRLGLDAALVRIAGAAADEVVVPDNWNCCGFAGDRGMLHPELTAAATRAEATTVAAVRTDAYASVNRTCEIGMTRATGFPYQHVLQVLAGILSG